MDAALGEFSKATAKNILRRVGVSALEPVAEAMKAKVPVDDMDLHDSIAVSTKLNKRQKRLNRDLAVVEVYAGPAGQGGGNAPPQGTLQEFGAEHHPPQPFARPAWDAEDTATLQRVKVGLATEIDKAAARAQRKALKAKG